MEFKKLTETQLKILLGFVGAASALIGFVVSILLVDANTKRQTNVQLIQVAVNLLSKKPDGKTESSDKVLRQWAVDTINYSADIKFSKEARKLLIDGKSRLAQTPLQHGAIRLTAGGGLFALPIVYEAMQSTIGDSKTPVGPSDLTKLPEFNVTK